MKKSEFRNLYIGVKSSFRTLDISISMPAAVICNRNKHQTFSYTGPKSLEKTFEYAWRYAKKSGTFEIDGMLFCTSTCLRYTASYMLDGKKAYYTFVSTSDKDAILYASLKLGRVKMSVDRLDEGRKIEIYNSLNFNRL